jgi:hypothetical protein
MESRECLRRVETLLRERVSGDLRDFHWAYVAYMAKAWYGNKDLHYEITWRERLGVIEIGLHFESDPLTNARLLAAFGANAKAVRRTLADARIEEWDRGWARVWEALPHRRPDLELATELADRIAGYVTTLERILRRELPSDVAWSEPEARSARARAAAKSRASRSAR